MKCEEVREMLPALAGEGDSLSVRRHLARCPECRAESAHYEALLTSLAGLSSVASEPPTGLLRSLQAIPSGGGRLDTMKTHLARNRTRYASGAAALVATGAAGALLWRTKARRPAHA